MSTHQPMINTHDQYRWSNHTLMFWSHLTECAPPRSCSSALRRQTGRVSSNAGQPPLPSSSASGTWSRSLGSHLQTSAQTHTNKGTPETRFHTWAICIPAKGQQYNCRGISTLVDVNGTSLKKKEEIKDIPDGGDLHPQCHGMDLYFRHGPAHVEHDSTWQDMESQSTM